MYFSQQQSSTDLYVVTCNLGKLNTGAKNCASHYNYIAYFALSAGTANDILLFSQLSTKVLFCSIIILLYVSSDL